MLLRLVRNHIITFNLIELGRVGKGTTVIEIRPEAQINVAILIAFYATDEKSKLRIST